MSAGVAIALLASTQLIATLNPDSEIELSGRDIRLGDVAVLSGGDLATRGAVAPRIVARLPAGQDIMTMSRAALAGLLRRAVPGVRTVGSQKGALRVRAPNAATIPSDQNCFVLSHPVARGAPLTMEDVRRAACEAGSVGASTMFDRRGSVVRAAADLADGSYLGRLVLPAERGVDRGERLTLRSVVGPVRIEREVVALQTGRPGRAVFVRGGDGETLAAPLSELAQRGDR